MLTVGGIVLCGGESSRMGLPKLSLPFGPESMLQRVVRLLGDAAAGPIVVVASPGQELSKLPSEVVVARDRQEGQGPLEGLCAGLKAIAGRADAAYATSCDVPLLKSAFVRRMIEALGDFQIAVPVEHKFHHPLAAVYRTSVTKQIELLLDAGRKRPVFLFDEVPTRRVPVEELEDVDPRLNTLANLNYPQDYFNALASAGFEAPPDVARTLTQWQAKQLAKPEKGGDL